MSLSLRKINISQFRSYEAARLDLTDGADGNIIVLTGANGAGKTNILEAISLLVPGKGLRNADIPEMKNRHAGAQESWAVAAEIETATGEIARIGTGLDNETGRRRVRIDGETVKSQSALSSLVAAVWLTPQMDRLFLEGASARRKFLDRLVAAATPEHSASLNRYEKAMRERMKILQGDRPADPTWLSALERQMSADGVAIAAARQALVERLQNHADHLGAKAPLFPEPLLSLDGWAENEIGRRPAVDIEDDLKNRLAAARGEDRASGRTHTGIHRADLAVFNKAKDMPAAQSSTGEQKALLVSVILAHALMMRAEKGFVPIILLDEVAAHLDAARREQLFSLLRALQGQVWLTGTDEAVFASLKDEARFFSVAQGRIHGRDVLRAFAT